MKSLARWACLAGCLVAAYAASAGERPAKLKHDVLVGAKLQLCPGLIDSNLMYYLETHMVGQYKDLGQGRLSDVRRKEILQQARKQFENDAKYNFTPDQAYQIRDIEGEISLLDTPSPGLGLTLPANVWFDHRPEDERSAGARNLADDERAIEATIRLATPGRFFLGHPQHYTSTRVVQQPTISVRLSF